MDAGADPGTANGQALLPLQVYVHPTGSAPRTILGSQPEIGACEVLCSSAAHSPARPAGLEKTGQRIYLIAEEQRSTLDVYDLAGRLVASGVRAFDWSGQPMGHFVVVLRRAGKIVWVGKA